MFEWIENPNNDKNTPTEIHFVFLGRMVSLLVIRASGSHRCLCSRRSLLYFLRHSDMLFVFSFKHFSYVPASELQQYIFFNSFKHGLISSTGQPVYFFSKASKGDICFTIGLTFPAIPYACCTPFPIFT